MQVFVDAAGLRRHVATRQPTRKEALVFLAELEGRVRRGLVGVPEPEPSLRLTVGDIVQRYLDEYSSPRIKDLERRRYECRSIFRRVQSHLATVPVAELTGRKLAQVRDEL